MCTAFGSWCAGASSNSFPPSEKVNKQIMKYCKTRIMWDNVAVVCTILAVEMFVVQADGKLKAKGRRSTLRNVSLYRENNRWSKYSRLKISSSIQDGGTDGGRWRASSCRKRQRGRTRAWFGEVRRGICPLLSSRCKERGMTLIDDLIGKTFRQKNWYFQSACVRGGRFLF